MGRNEAFVVKAALILLSCLLPDPSAYAGTFVPGELFVTLQEEAPSLAKPGLPQLGATQLGVASLDSSLRAVSARGIRLSSVRFDVERAARRFVLEVPPGVSVPPTHLSSQRNL